jgi:hypothetical protein
MCAMEQFSKKIPVGGNFFQKDKLSLDDNTEVLLIFLFASCACCLIILALIVCRALRRNNNHVDTDSDEE